MIVKVVNGRWNCVPEVVSKLVRSIQLEEPTAHIRKKFCKQENYKFIYR